MSDLVSVIVPAYNAERFLARCADSVLTQSHQNLELILIDDGSTDATGVICDEYAVRDRRVVVIHQENKGVSAARNAGIDKSKGTYIVFSDADDELLPDGVEILLSEIKTSGADIAACTSYLEKKGRIVSDPPSSGRRRVIEGLEGLKSALEDRGFTRPVWAKMFRRAFIGDLRFVEGKRVHEDAFFMVECFCRQPTMVLYDQRVYIYHVTDGSASRAAFNEKFLDILFFAERKLQMIGAQYPQFEALAYNTAVKANMVLLENLCRTWDPKFRQTERDCIAAVRRYRKYFIPVSRRNRQWFFVIRNHLYYIYKILYSIKHRNG